MVVYCKVCWKEIEKEISKCPSCGNTLTISGKLPHRTKDGQLVITETLLQRIIGMMTFNIEILHDIRKRSDLTKERFLLGGVSILLIVNLRLLPFIIFPDNLNVDPLFLILYTFSSTIIGSTSFLLSMMYLAQQFKGPGPDFSIKEILGTLVYLYPVLIIDYTVFTFLISLSTSWLGLLAVIVFLYTYYLFSAVLKQLFHNTEMGSLLALVFSLFTWLLIEIMIYLAFLSFSI